MSTQMPGGWSDAGRQMSGDLSEGGDLRSEIEENRQYLIRALRAVEATTVECRKEAWNASAKASRLEEALEAQSETIRDLREQLYTSQKQLKDRKSESAPSISTEEVGLLSERIRQVESEVAQASKSTTSKLRGLQQGQKDLNTETAARFQRSESSLDRMLQAFEAQEQRFEELMHSSQVRIDAQITNSDSLTALRLDDLEQRFRKQIGLVQGEDKVVPERQDPEDRAAITSIIERLDQNEKKLISCLHKVGQNEQDVGRIKTERQMDRDNTAGIRDFELERIRKQDENVERLEQSIEELSLGLSQVQAKARGLQELGEQMQRSQHAVSHQQTLLVSRLEETQAQFAQEKTQSDTLKSVVAALEYKAEEMSAGLDGLGSWMKGSLQASEGKEGASQMDKSFSEIATLKDAMQKLERESEGMKADQERILSTVNGICEDMLKLASKEDLNHVTNRQRVDLQSSLEHVKAAVSESTAVATKQTAGTLAAQTAAETRDLFDSLQTQMDQVRSTQTLIQSDMLELRSRKAPSEKVQTGTSKDMLELTERLEIVEEGLRAAQNDVDRAGLQASAGAESKTASEWAVEQVQRGLREVGRKVDDCVSRQDAVEDKLRAEQRAPGSQLSATSASDASHGASAVKPASEWMMEEVRRGLRELGRKAQVEEEKLERVETELNALSSKINLSADVAQLVDGFEEQRRPVRLTLDRDFETWNQEKEDELKGTICNVTSFLAPWQINVVNVSRGSVVVEFLIRSDHWKEAVAALEEDFGHADSKLKKFAGATDLVTPDGGDWKLSATGGADADSQEVGRQVQEQGEKLEVLARLVESMSDGVQMGLEKQGSVEEVAGRVEALEASMRSAMTERQDGKPAQETKTTSAAGSTAEQQVMRELAGKVEGMEWELRAMRADVGSVGEWKASVDAVKLNATESRKIVGDLEQKLNRLGSLETVLLPALYKKIEAIEKEKTANVDRGFVDLMQKEVSELAGQVHGVDVELDTVLKSVAEQSKETEGLKGELAKDEAYEETMKSLERLEQSFGNLEEKMLELDDKTQDQRVAVQQALVDFAVRMETFEKGLGGHDAKSDTPSGGADWVIEELQRGVRELGRRMHELATRQDLMGEDMRGVRTDLDKGGGELLATKLQLEASMSEVERRILPLLEESRHRGAAAAESAAQEMQMMRELAGKVEGMEWNLRALRADVGKVMSQSEERAQEAAAAQASDQRDPGELGVHELASDMSDKFEEMVSKQVDLEAAVRLLAGGQLEEENQSWLLELSQRVQALEHARDTNQPATGKDDASTVLKVKEGDIGAREELIVEIRRLAKELTEKVLVVECELLNVKNELNETHDRSIKDGGEVSKSQGTPAAQMTSESTVLERVEALEVKFRQVQLDHKVRDAAEPTQETIDSAMARVEALEAKLQADSQTKAAVSGDDVETLREQLYECTQEIRAHEERLVLLNALSLSQAALEQAVEALKSGAFAMQREESGGSEMPLEADPWEYASKIDRIEQQLKTLSPLKDEGAGLVEDLRSVEDRLQALEQHRADVDTHLASLADSSLALGAAQTARTPESRTQANAPTQEMTTGGSGVTPPVITSELGFMRPAMLPASEDPSRTLFDEGEGDGEEAEHEGSSAGDPAEEEEVTQIDVASLQALLASPASFMQTTIPDGEADGTSVNSSGLVLENGEGEVAPQFGALRLESENRQEETLRTALEASPAKTLGLPSISWSHRTGRSLQSQGLQSVAEWPMHEDEEKDQMLKTLELLQENLVTRMANLKNRAAQEDALAGAVLVDEASHGHLKQVSRDMQDLSRSLQGDTLAETSLLAQAVHGETSMLHQSQGDPLTHSILAQSWHADAVRESSTLSRTLQTSVQHETMQATTAGEGELSWAVMPSSTDPDGALNAVEDDLEIASSEEQAVETSQERIEMLRSLETVQALLAKKAQLLAGKDDGSSDGDAEDDELRMGIERLVNELTGKVQEVEGELKSVRAASHGQAPGKEGQPSFVTNDTLMKKVQDHEERLLLLKALESAQALLESKVDSLELAQAGAHSSFSGAGGGLAEIQSQLLELLGKVEAQGQKQVSVEGELATLREMQSSFQASPFHTTASGVEGTMSAQRGAGLTATPGFMESFISHITPNRNRPGTFVDSGLTTEIPVARLQERVLMLERAFQDRDQSEKRSVGPEEDEEEDGGMEGRLSRVEQALIEVLENKSLAGGEDVNDLSKRLASFKASTHTVVDGADLADGRSLEEQGLRQMVIEEELRALRVDVEEVAQSLRSDPRLAVPCVPLSDYQKQLQETRMVLRAMSNMQKQSSSGPAEAATVDQVRECLESCVSQLLNLSQYIASQDSTTERHREDMERWKGNVQTLCLAECRSQLSELSDAVSRLWTVVSPRPETEEEGDPKESFASASALHLVEQGLLSTIDSLQSSVTQLQDDFHQLQSQPAPPAAAETTQAASSGSVEPEPLEDSLVSAHPASENVAAQPTDGAPQPSRPESGFGMPHGESLTTLSGSVHAPGVSEEMCAEICEMRFNELSKPLVAGLEDRIDGACRAAQETAADSEELKQQVETLSRDLKVMKKQMRVTLEGVSIPSRSEPDQLSDPGRPSTVEAVPSEFPDGRFADEQPEAACAPTGAVSQEVRETLSGPMGRVNQEETTRGGSPSVDELQEINQKLKRLEVSVDMLSDKFCVQAVAVEELQRDGETVMMAVAKIEELEAADKAQMGESGMGRSPSKATDPDPADPLLDRIAKQEEELGKLTDLQQRVSNLEEDYAQVITERGADFTLFNLQEQVRRVEKDIKQVTDTTGELEQVIRDMAAEESRHSAVADALNEATAKLEGSVPQLAQRIDEAVEDAATKDSTVAVQSQQLASVEEALQKAVERLSPVEERMSDLDACVKTLQEQTATLEQKLEEAQVAAPQEEALQKAVERLAPVEERMSDLDACVKTLQEQTAALEQKLEEAEVSAPQEEALQKAVERLSPVEDRMSDLDACVKTLQEQTATLEQKLEEAEVSASQVDEGVQTGEEDAATRLTQLEGRLDHQQLLLRQMEGMGDDLLRREADQDKIIEELRDMAKTSSEAMASKAEEEQLKDLEARKENQEQRVSELETVKADKKKVQEIEAVVAEHAKKLAEFQEDFDKADESQLAERLSKLERSALGEQGKQPRIGMLESKLAELDEAMEVRESDNAEMDGRVKDLELQEALTKKRLLRLDSLEGRCDALGDEIATLQLHVDDNFVRKPELRAIERQVALLTKHDRVMQQASTLSPVGLAEVTPARDLRLIAEGSGVLTPTEEGPWGADLANELSIASEGSARIRALAARVRGVTQARTGMPVIPTSPQDGQLDESSQALEVSPRSRLEDTAEKIRLWEVRNQEGHGAEEGSHRDHDPLTFV